MNYLLYVFTGILFSVSYFKDKNKTKIALKKAWKSFENILPDFLVIISLVGLIVAFLNPEVISGLIGNESGVQGVFLSSVVGSITLIPGFIAFPMAAILLKSGAGYMQIGAFISSLMMVGIITAPLEIKYFGKKITFFRNFFAFLFSFFVAFIIGIVVNGL